jgi:hypothetical protein
VGLNAEAIEFDLMLPIVADRHALGQHRTTGLDVLEEHVEIVGSNSQERYRFDGSAFARSWRGKFGRFRPRSMRAAG